MNKIWLVFQREYLSRVKNKAFWLITLLAPIGVLFLAFLPVLINQFSNEQQNIAVIDQSDKFANVFKDDSNTKYKIEKSELDELKKNYSTKGFTAILFIPDLSLNKPINLYFYSKNPLGLKLKTNIITQVNQKIVQLKLEDAKLDPEFAKNLESNVVLESKIIDKEGEKSGSTTIGTIVGYASGLIIYIVLLVYGSMVMQGVLEEKNSRIVEILISSIKPFELMLGKILGIAFVGLTQFVVWIFLTMFGFTVTGIILSPILLQNPKISTSSNSITNIETTDNSINSMNIYSSASINAETASMIEEINGLNFNLIFIYFITFFLGGYLLYASLFAAIGSAVNNEKEASGLMLPVMMPIIISFMFLFSVTQNPNGDLAFWLSIIPFTSPIIMLSRIPFGVPWWQILLSASVLFSTFIGVAYLAAKIYRIGILSYGSKPKIKDLWRWMTS